MKKYILGFLILAVFIITAAYTVNKDQSIMTESVNGTLEYDNSYVWYTGVTRDTIGVGDSIWEYTIRKKSLSKLTPYVQLALDSVGGTKNNVTITLESKCFEAESYTPRETKTWKLGADTTLIIISDTAHISEFWKVKLKGANDIFKVKVTRLNLKFAQ
jgi:hypothetical protein